MDVEKTGRVPIDSFHSLRKFSIWPCYVIKTDWRFSTHVSRSYKRPRHPDQRRDGDVIDVEGDDIIDDIVDNVDVDVDLSFPLRKLVIS